MCGVDCPKSRRHVPDIPPALAGGRKVALVGKTVLIVDDDLLFRAAMGDGLRAAGYAVAVAADGLEALQRVREAPPDFILLDLIMPKLDGFRVCKMLKGHPQHRSIPVIVLSGLSKEGLTNLTDLGAEVAIAKRDAGATLTEIVKTLHLLGSARLKPLPLVESARDLAERRIVSELLAERQHTQTLLATLGEGVVELDEGGRVVYVNPAALDLVDRTEDAILGAPGSDLFGAAHVAALQHTLREIQTGSQGPTVRLELPRGRKTIGITLTALRRPDGPPGAVFVLRDLTDLTRRTRSLEALAAVGRHILGQLELAAVLREIVARTGELLETDRVALFRVERAGDQLRLRCTEALGLSERYAHDIYLAPGEGVVGRGVQERQPVWSSDLLHDPLIPLSDSLRVRVEEEGIGAVLAAPVLLPEEVFGALTVYRPVGHRFPPEEVEFVTSLAGCAALAIENARLYAETRKAYEDLRAAQDQLVHIEKFRALGEMAGGVAHDFNNLLSVILGRAQLLRMKTADPELRRDLQVIEGAAQDGAATVRRLLGFARARPEAQYAPVALATLLEEVLEVTRPRWKDAAQARGAPIEALLALEPVPPVLGDAAELREALLNLIFNAVDAMPQGGRLTLGARLVPPPAAGGPGTRTRGSLAGAPGEPTECVEVFVRDTGVGMTEEVRARAFEPFFTTKGAKGSGLGLAMIYGIVARHGGEALLDSHEGTGTTVTLRLPATAQVAEDPQGAVRPPAARASRLVVVDDDERVKGALAELLCSQGHRVQAFTDPREALVHLAQEPADVLFTDLGMPGMLGWEVARRARELWPDLPVVLVTGWGDQIDPEQVGQLHVTAVVKKPFRAEEVLRLVAELMPAPPEAQPGPRDETPEVLPG